MISEEVSPNNQDAWEFPWGRGNFSTKKVYLGISGSQPDPIPFKWIWKSPRLPKHKIFFWLTIQDILITKDLMARKNFCVESLDCVLCEDSTRETRMHLFFGCEFSHDFWSRLGDVWNYDPPFMDMLLDTKQRSNNQFFKIALIAGCWSLWTHKNKIIFENEQRGLKICFNYF